MFKSNNLSLLTDLYQLTMAYGYWKNNIHKKEAVFHLFFRKNPFQGTYAIACGLASVIDYIQDFHFSTSDIEYLSQLKGANGKVLFESTFLEYLSHLKIDCTIDAIPEGTMVFPHQPLIRIKGDLLQAQLLETTLLNLVNFPTLIATKAARIVSAAEGDEVLEFGLRRAQGIDGGLSASRAAYIGGCHATSNVLAGKIYAIPIKGTHAHSWVMSFEDEQEAFRAYAESMPNNCVFLVDTYNTVEGIKKAIQIGHKLRQEGHEMLGIRLDSGDLCKLSIIARQLLDEAGFPKAKIIASNDLDEYAIQKLKTQGAKINVWGIGTRLSTAYDQPALGGVYKLAAIRNNKRWDYKVKRSEELIKTSNPGILQVKRIFHKGLPVGDILYNELEKNLTSSIIDKDEKEIVLHSSNSKNLLVPIFKKGKLVYHSPSATEIRAQTLEQLELFKNIVLYPQGLEKNLFFLKKRILLEKSV